MERPIVRTLEIPEGFSMKGEQRHEIEFRSPNGWLVAEVSEINTRNEYAKRTRDVVDPFGAIFRNLTGFPLSILKQLTYKSSQKIAKTVGEIMDEGSGEDEEDEEEK